MLNPSSMTVNGKEAITLLFVGAINRHFGYTNVLSTQTVPLKCMLEGGVMMDDAVKAAVCKHSMGCRPARAAGGESGKYDTRT